MKNLSIRLKITLWYTVFMTLLAFVILWLLFSASSSRILSDAKLRLQDTVIRSFHEIEYEHGALEIDDDIDYLGEGIHISLYDSGGSLLYGRIPSRFEGAPRLIMDEFQQVEADGTLWYVYDYCQQIEGYGNLWVRGIASQSQNDAALHTISRLSLIFLPFFILCIAVGGYLIIRRTLAPLAAMTETAQRISGGSDLSERIRLGAGEDEVHRLAHTFDRMMDHLQASFENEKQFTSDVSHELRTPVSVILSQGEYALQEGASTEEMRTCLGVITAQAKKMSSLIAQLLTLAHTDNGARKLRLELLNLSELAELVAEEQKIPAAEKHITIETNIQPDLLLCADETMMVRLLINLVSNSIAYGREGGRTRITLARQDASVIGSVEDDGIGIREKDLDKIWNRFYQVDPARSRSGSSGLGLPMVKWIVEAHGGSVSVTSTPGKGSAFRFTLPS